MGSRSRARMRKRLEDTYGRFCGICIGATKISNKEVATLDHKIPKALGGSSDTHNCQLAHEECNKIKGAMQQRCFRLIRIKIPFSTLYIIIYQPYTKHRK